MRRLWAISACLLTVALAAPAQACTRPKGAGGIESGIVDWINAERSKKGLAKLRLNAGLDAAAERHACDMAAKGGLNHDRFAERMRGAGYRTGVENVARSGDASAEAAAQIWRDSAQHWENILNRSIRDVGVGTAVGGGRTYYVFMAGK